MRLLLDTHTFLWFIDDSPQLSKHGQCLLYTGGELPRLMRSGPPRRAVTAVWEGELARAALPGRDR